MDPLSALFLLLQQGDVDLRIMQEEGDESSRHFNLIHNRSDGTASLYTVPCSVAPKTQLTKLLEAAVEKNAEG